MSPLNVSSNDKFDFDVHWSSGCIDESQERASASPSSTGAAEFAVSGSKANLKTRPHDARLCHVLMLGLLLLVTAGCAEQLPTDYGSRSDPRSVNGTSAFSHLFTVAGHRVRTASSLSPRLFEDTDIIVWFASQLGTPSDEVTAWLDEWLMESPMRTLIYVGRDYDAAPDYWQRVAAHAPADQKAELLRRQAEAMANFQSFRRGYFTGDDDQCDWFTIDRTWNPREVTQIDGDSDLLDGVDRNEVHLKLYSRIQPDFAAKPLLWSGSDVLVSTQYRYQGEVIVVANGSFLLNLPLLDPQNRVLATRLIEWAAPPGEQRNVVFLKTLYGDPAIRTKDEQDGGVEFPAPLDQILLHLAVLGLVFCFARWPLFGRPRQLESRSPGDFGQHIEALGKMLQRSKDQAFATARLLHYQQRRRDGNRDIESPQRLDMQPPAESPDD